MAGSYTPDVKRVLAERGCRFHRQGKGDHSIWYSPISKRYFTVDAKLLSRHTANAIMKQAGIDHKF
jgi:predicted RNA binding protein YcfA (HicA-like mRNA interferase family)